MRVGVINALSKSSALSSISVWLVTALTLGGWFLDRFSSLK